MADPSSPCSSFSFLAVCRYLNYSGLWVRWNQSVSFVQCPRVWGTSCLPSSTLLGGEKSFRTGSLLLALSSASLGDGWSRQNGTFPPTLFVWFLLHCVAEATSASSWALSELFFFVDCYLIAVICRRLDSGFFYSATLVTSLSKFIFIYFLYYGPRQQ